MKRIVLVAVLLVIFCCNYPVQSKRKNPNENSPKNAIKKLSIKDRTTRIFIFLHQGAGEPAYGITKETNWPTSKMKTILTEYTMVNVTFLDGLAKKGNCDIGYLADLIYDSLLVCELSIRADTLPGFLQKDTLLMQLRKFLCSFPLYSSVKGSIKYYPGDTAVVTPYSIEAFKFNTLPILKFETEQ